MQARDIKAVGKRKPRGADVKPVAPLLASNDEIRGENSSERKNLVEYRERNLGENRESEVKETEGKNLSEKKSIVNSENRELTGVNFNDDRDSVISLDDALFSCPGSKISGDNFDRMVERVVRRNRERALEDYEREWARDLARLTHDLSYPARDKYNSAERTADRETEKKMSSGEIREIAKVVSEQSEQTESGDEGEIISVASFDNRHFMTVTLGGQSYKALFDPGAVLSLAGARIAERFKERLQPSNTLIRTVTGATKPVLGTLKFALEIDGHTAFMTVKASDAIMHDIIFGMDFVKIFDVDARLARGLWRVHEGEWKPFDQDDSGEETQVMAECAGISEMRDYEREMIQRLAASIILEPTEILGMTDLTEHHIDVQEAPPVRHKAWRLSPMMLKVAEEEVEKMLRKGIIEKSVSDWSSAPVIIRKPDGGWRFCI